MSTHTVRPGETLSAVARANGVSVAELVRLNGIRDPDMIVAGETLIVAPPPVPEAASAMARAGTEAAQTASSGPPGAAATPCTENDEPFKIRAGGDDNADVVYLTVDANAERSGLLGHADVKAAAGMASLNHHGHFGDSNVGGSHKLDTMTASSEAAGGIVYGAGARAAAKASMVSQEASVLYGPDLDNPYGEGGVDYALLQAEAKGDALIGSDGRRAGLALGGKLGAAAAEGNIKGEVNFPIPFRDWTVSIRGKGGASAGSLGVGAGAHAYQDLETGRYHAGAEGEAAALLGLFGGLDISVGPPYTNRERKAGP